MNESCLITGGSSGIGLATAKRFATEGWSLLITGRNADRLAAAAEQIESTCNHAKVLTRSVDVGDPNSVRETTHFAHEQLGHVQVLVNNAGIAPNVPIQEMTYEQFAETVTTNIGGVFNFVSSIWPLMKSGGSGTIINISSQAATNPFPGFSVYGGTKAFVDLFTKAAAEEGKADNIAVFSVRPGAVDTPLLRQLFPDFPLNQAVTAEDVANVIWQLSQPEMRFSVGDPISVKR